MAVAATWLAPPGTTVRAERRQILDAARYFSVFAVILIHALPNPAASYHVTVEDVISEASRFAVPFFFILSGFLLSKRDLKTLSPVIFSIVRRLLPIYIIWVLFYLILNFHSAPSPSSPKAWLHLILTGGPGFHLWFLPALGLSMALVSSMASYLDWSWMFVTALGLYVIGLAIGPYAGLFSSIPRTTDTWLQIARDGPFFGTIFVLFGLWLAKVRWRPGVGLGLFLFIAGLMLQLTEAYVLDIWHLNYFKDNDLLVGTLPFGVGAFLLALRLPSEGPIIGVCATAGRCTLGIYAIHLYFVLLLQNIFHPPTLIGKFVLAVIVLAAATSFSLAMARVKPLRFLVT